MHANVRFCSPADDFLPARMFDGLRRYGESDGLQRVGSGAVGRVLSSRRLRPEALPWKFVLWLLLAGLLKITGAIASEAAEEAETRSKFLVNFAQFTEWPSTAFTSGKAPLVIGILGTDPFGSYLDKLVENEVVRGHRVRILRYRKVEELRTCHILYIGESEGPRLDRIVRAVKEKPVLTVSEIQDSVAQGLMIRMKVEDRKVHLAINLKAAKDARLTLKSKLLRLGEIVESEKK